jgi:hypothetical protein
VQLRNQLLRLILLTALALPLGVALAQAQSAVVPKKHEALYRQLERQLGRFVAQVPWTTSDRPVLRGAAWAAAGCDPVPTLLEEPRRERALRELDALARAGAQLVTLEVCYPLLSSRFQDPRPILEHYANLANAVRLRGMKLLVRSRALPPTDGSITASRYYVRLGKERFFRERYDDAKSIALALQPDYLTLVADPLRDTAALKLTTRDWRGFLRRTTADLKAALGDFTPALGAELGLSASAELVDALAAVPGLDYIELRVDRLATQKEQFLPRLLSWPERIRSIDPGKRILIGDAWLYKAGAQEAAGAMPKPGITARDVYSFWAPLDIDFLRVLVHAARAGSMEAVVASRPRYLFAYLDFFDPTIFRATPLLLMELAERQANAAIAGARLTDTGRAFGAL